MKLCSLFNDGLFCICWSICSVGYVSPHLKSSNNFTPAHCNLFFPQSRVIEITIQVKLYFKKDNIPKVGKKKSHSLNSVLLEIFFPPVIHVPLAVLVILYTGESLKKYASRPSSEIHSNDCESFRCQRNPTCEVFCCARNFTRTYKTKQNFQL